MAVEEKSNSIQFIKYGNKMKVESVEDSTNNTLTYIGKNKWNTGYCNELYLKDNKIEICIKIKKLSVSYGCVIGIVSNPVYINDYFHFNKFDIISYALKSDSSQFCKGKKIGKKGKNLKLEMLLHCK